MPRPQWVEATALLAAAGFPPPPKNYRQNIWRRFNMKPAPFAILPRLNAVDRPRVFADLAGLAAHIQRARHGQGLELVEVEDLHHQWRAEGGGQGVDLPEGVPDRGVQIWTLDLGHNRDRCIGWAWLNGGGMERLREALARAETVPARRSTALGLIADSSPLRTRQAAAAMAAGRA